MGDSGRTARNVTRGLAMFGAGALVLHGWRLGLSILGTPVKYQVNRERLPPVDSIELRDYLSTITGAPVRTDTKISVLRNADEFYPAELAAIGAAQASIHLEAYGFQEGEVTRQFLEAMAARASTGVQVRLMVDAVGSWRTGSRYFDALRAAGGRIEWYHAMNSRSWPYLNNRTHRKLLIVDGRIGFAGGAGFADHWIKPNASGPPWRDTMFRLEGGAAANLDAVFAENWLETTGEILPGTGPVRAASADGGAALMVIASTPRSGTTQARILYQVLMESAVRQIHITTPYFVPDRSARQALERAARDRGVTVKILTAGKHNDHGMTRNLSHVLESRLMKAGAAIYEYRPSMIHAKLMTIDGIWTVAGSTNFDHRSFDLNDEVNLAIFDRGIAGRIDENFARDLAESRQLTPHDLRKADFVDRMEGHASWLLRRQE